MRRLCAVGVLALLALGAFGFHCPEGTCDPAAPRVQLTVSGDAPFVAQVAVALQVLYGAGWRRYVETALDEVREANTNEWPGQCAWTDYSEGRYRANFVPEVCGTTDSIWLAQTLAHESAHAMLARQGLKDCGQYGESLADAVTEAFAVSVASPWWHGIRRPEWIPEMPASACRPATLPQGRMEY